MDVLEAIRTRRSIGRLSGHISHETIRGLVEAATWAPNHRLTEPWRFTVVEGDARDALAHRWGEIAGSEAEEADRAVVAAREGPKLLRAPVLLIVSSRTDTDPVLAFEDHAATAAAIENLLLAAHAQGLGAVWRSGAMAYHAAFKIAVGLEPSDAILGIVYLGEPAMNAPAAHPRRLDETIVWLSSSASVAHN